MVFIRGDVTVESKPAIVIWTSRAVQYTTASVASVNNAVRASGLGKTQEKRDFLKDGIMDTTILKTNSMRRSCIALFLNDPRWPKRIRDKITAG